MSGIGSLCSLALAIRLCLIGYGVWQDHHFLVKYTDVDYQVFTDAARHVWEGDSPYERLTYRYSPRLSYIILPNVFLFESFGKVLFALADIGVGVIIYRICVLRGVKVEAAKFWCASWLFHPLSVNISTRGNADSIACLLILLTLYYQLQGKNIKTAVCFGLSVHFRIFPIYFGPTLVLFYISKYRFVGSIPHILLLGLISGGIFLSLLALFYGLYGYQFLFETYLYHFIRKDNRHNFSVYFYDLYLKYGDQSSTLTALLAFIPQIMVQLSASLYLHRDLSFAFLIQTLALVAFNKVSTSQYFLWYVALFPVVLPFLQIRKKTAIGLVLLWIIGQANWLFWAYRLEFLGENTFDQVWTASILFFLVNIFIIWQLLDIHAKTPNKKRS